MAGAGHDLRAAGRRADNPVRLASAPDQSRLAAVTIFAFENAPHTPALYSLIDPGYFTEYAERTVLGESPTVSPAVDAEMETDDSQMSDFGGKGGTRTLDPGIMRRWMPYTDLCIQLLTQLLKPPSGR